MASFGFLASELDTRSVGRNPLLADLLHRISFIEKAGTGIKPMCDEARTQGCPEPTFEESGFFTATFLPNPEVRALATSLPDPITQQVAGQVAGQVTPEVVKMLEAMSGEMTRKDLQTALKLQGRANFVDCYLKPTLGLGLVEMTIPDKPRSRMQKYRLTPAGKAVLNRVQETKVTPENR